MSVSTGLLMSRRHRDRRRRRHPHLWGGGLHPLPHGGKFAIQTNFNFHKAFGLDRRVNVPVYLNRDWPEAYSGHLEA